ncbi:MAG: hypothetical protein LC808_10645 [Actinobacteria bacterium]|nr:hypothetical protein [Actinomycetota bacterium]
MPVEAPSAKSHDHLAVAGTFAASTRSGPSPQLLIHCIGEQLRPNEILERVPGSYAAEGEDRVPGDTAGNELCSDGLSTLVIVGEAQDFACVVGNTVDAVFSSHECHPHNPRVPHDLPGSNVPGSVPALVWVQEERPSPRLRGGAPGGR